jgi:hypothetical protein
MFTISKGSYVPALSFATTPATNPVVAAVGSYTRIGKTVHFYAKLTQTTEGANAAGHITISLPSVPSSQFRAHICGNTVGVAAQAGSVAILVKYASGKLCKLYDMVEAGTQTALTHAAITDGSVIEIEGTYEEL